MHPVPTPGRRLDAPPAIEAVGLVKTYRSGRRAVRALDGLDLSAPAGAVLGLLGPNGAGKSTAVRILATLSRPDVGSARVAGLDVVRDPAAVRRAIGYVAQRAVADPMDTGRENLVLAARLQGLGAREARLRAAELLTRFDLEEAADRQVRTYSGGLARRLDVAVGLVHRPQVLFLDEPTTGLDPEARASLWAEIARMAGAEGMTVVLTTHYLDEADALADTLVVVDHGRVVVGGTPDALKDGLRGDGVRVTFADPAQAERAVAAASRVAQVWDVAREGRTVRARAASGAAALPAVLAALEAAGLDALEASLSRPSLDDVYRQHTGHAFAVGPDAGPGAGQGAGAAA